MLKHCSTFVHRLGCGAEALLHPRQKPWMQSLRPAEALVQPYSQETVEAMLSKSKSTMLLADR